MDNNINEKNIPQLTASDFEFVNDSISGKIKDQKFQTKSTTFVRDAFKRFCKSKSSVVAAIIIAILMLLSIFYPIFSPYNTTSTQDMKCYLLPSKLFDAGAGWWDGCEMKDAVLSFDGENYLPSGTEYNKPRAVIGDYIYHDVEYYDYNNPNFIGGTLRVVARYKLGDSAASGKDSFYIENGVGFQTSADDNCKATILMDDIDNLSEAKLSDFRISLGTGNTEKTDNYTFIPVTDWSHDYPTDENNPLVIDVSKFLKDNNIPEGKFVRLRIEVKLLENIFSYALVNSVTFTSDNEENADTLANRSMIDANYTCCLESTKSGHWRSTGAMYMYQAQYARVSYRYDMYEHKLGLYPDFSIGKSLMDEYEAKGWCKVDWAGLAKDKENPDKYFTILDEKNCPIVKDDDGVALTSYTESIYKGETVTNFTANVQYYKYIGYSSMPRYLFGSDAAGRDLVTHSLRCLKNSLLLSIICCAICIAIGLVWGAVSGYYGGKTDLIMERITDILAGIPSTVLLTLMLLILGRTTVTFAFAVCLTGWIGTSSLTRTQFYRFKNREYVLASRTLGASDKRLIFKHILPNALGTIVTSSVLSIPGFIFTEASLAFLHLGLDSGDSFGVILSSNQEYISVYPPLVLFPAFILCLLMISFNLFGNGLRDALNPTLKGGEQ